jgi:hypothetical protein
LLCFDDWRTSSVEFGRFSRIRPSREVSTGAGEASLGVARRPITSDTSTRLLNVIGEKLRALSKHRTAEPHFLVLRGGGDGLASMPAVRERADAERKMVLPDRIELSTSPLPRECSTTELRQQALRPSSSAAPAAHVERQTPLKAGRSLPQRYWPRKRASRRCRHSGAPRSGGPGIHNYRQRIWIPDLSLRASPE